MCVMLKKNKYKTTEAAVGTWGENADFETNEGFHIVIGSISLE